jgi:hypothetical protein
MKLKTPIILFWNKKFIVLPEEGISVYQISFPSTEVMLTMLSAKKGHRDVPGWLMEADGKFRDFRPAGVRKSSIWPLSKLAGLSKSEFAISAPRAISVGEFSERLQEAKKNGVRDAQLSRLLAHLQQYNPEELVADKVLREWPL